MSIPVHPQIQIFTDRPAADAATFGKSLIIDSNTDYVDVCVLYGADLKNVGALDNTASEASSSYSKSVTTGFTFSSTQKIDITATVGVNVEIVTASVSVSVGISFTETWNKSQTVTLAVNAPAGAKAFIYQGYLMASVLRFNASDGSYQYQSNGKFLTEALTTSKNELVVHGT